MKIFRDRSEAGRELGKSLAGYAGRNDVIVLALPRGGVPVAYEAARALGAPLDIFLVRKLGVPGQEELAMGAIASGGEIVRNTELIRQLGISEDDFDAVVHREAKELQRREAAYRGDRESRELSGKTVIVIDDGLATGASMRAAVEALRASRPARIVVAVPVAAREVCADFARRVDEAVCLFTPEPFYAVGAWYHDFSQTSDDEVRALLVRAAREEGGARPLPLRKGDSK